MHEPHDAHSNLSAREHPNPAAIYARLWSPANLIHGIIRVMLFCIAVFAVLAAIHELYLFAAQK